MQIPDYRAKAIITHLRKIVANARCNPDDTSTLNALRLAKADLLWLEKQISKNGRTILK